MSYPRRVLPGMTVMITRRALRRTMLLRPDQQLNQLFQYTLSVLAERFEIDVHQYTVMSNHYHLIATDTHGVLPDFLRELNRTLALGIKTLRGWEGAAWDHDKPSVVELRTDQAVIEAMADAAANPVAANAVRHAHQWPGLTVLPEQLGQASFTVKRPDLYFDQDNPQWPATATLQLSMPCHSMPPAVVRDAVSRELARLEDVAHDAAKTARKKPLGRNGVLATSPYDRATSWEPLRKRNPTFAVGRGLREAFFDAVRVLREFRTAYRAALEAWRARARDVVFPLGTWFMRWGHAAQVASA